MRKLDVRLRSVNIVHTNLLINFEYIYMVSVVRLHMKCICSSLECTRRTGKSQKLSLKNFHLTIESYFYHQRPHSEHTVSHTHTNNRTNNWKCHLALRISFNSVLFSFVRSVFLRRLLLHCVWVNVWLYWYKWLQTTRINHISVMTAFLLCFLCVQYNDNNKFIWHGPQLGRDRHALHRQTHTYLFIRWKQWTVWKELGNVGTSCHLILLNWSLIELLAASDGSSRRVVGRLLWKW